MTDDADGSADAGTDAADGSDADEPTSAAGSGERTTAPQSPYTRHQLAIGLAVFLVGAVVAFGIPLALS